MLLFMASKKKKAFKQFLLPIHLYEGQSSVVKFVSIAGEWIKCYNDKFIIKNLHLISVDLKRLNVYMRGCALG